MADASSIRIQNHCADRDFSRLTEALSTLKQALHPGMDLCVIQLDRCLSHARPNRAEASNVPPQVRMTVPSAPSLFGSSRTSSAPATATELSAFASSEALDPQLQRFLEDASARLCEWLGSASKRSPLPALRLLPDAFPETQGVGADRLLDDLQQLMDGSYQPNHPGALAHLDPPPNTASIAAELICAGLNNNLLAEELSPSLSQLERQLCSWFAARFELPDGSGGVAASGGSLSNLTALVTARHRMGLDHDPGAVILISDDAHVSLGKAARVMGLRPDGIRRVRVDSQGCMLLANLQENLQELTRQNRPCIAVVATAGTTVRGAIDPIPALAQFCRDRGLWLHVDGAIGAVFALCPGTSHLMAGLGQVDSITVNPQKLLGIAKTSSLLLVRDQSALQETFHTGLPYMEPSFAVAHGGELGLQGSRPAEILKLWLGLRQLGDQGINAVLEKALLRRQRLEKGLDPSALEITSGPLHLLACAPLGADPTRCDQWSAALRQRLLDRQIMVSRPLHQGRHRIKVVLGNPHTSNALIDQLAADLNDCSGEVA